MVTDRDLRKLGLCERQPARRKMLALLLEECSLEAAQFVLDRSINDVGAEGGHELATMRLVDGSWRDMWEVETRRRAVVEVEAMEPDRLQAVVAARVIGDRRSIAAVAFELGLTLDRVRAQVMAEVAARGLDEQRVAQIVDVRLAASRKPKRPAPATAVVDKRTSSQIVDYYARAGRRAPAQVFEALGAEVPHG